MKHVMKAKGKSVKSPAGNQPGMEMASMTQTGGQTRGDKIKEIMIKQEDRSQREGRKRRVRT